MDSQSIKLLMTDSCIEVVELGPQRIVDCVSLGAAPEVVFGQPPARHVSGDVGLLSEPD